MHKLAPYYLILPAGLLVIFYFSALSLLFAFSFYKFLGPARMSAEITLAQYFKFFNDPFYLTYFYRSLKVATWTTVVVLLLGYPTAYVMTRASRPWRRLITILLIVHFFSSYVLRMYAVMLILGNNGLINRGLILSHVIEKPLKLMYNEFGVGVGLILGALPLMVFPVSSVLANIHASLEEAAETLGADKARVFWKITFPLCIPGIAAGVILVFLYNLSAFVTPALLGGGFFDMVANFIYEQALAVFNYPMGGASSLLILLLALGIIFLLNRAFERFIRGIPLK